MTFKTSLKVEKVLKRTKEEKFSQSDFYSKLCNLLIVKSLQIYKMVKGGGWLLCVAKIQGEVVVLNSKFKA